LKTVSSPSKPTRKDESAEIADMRRRGLKLEEIAAIKGVKKAAISRRLGRAGVEHTAIARIREDMPNELVVLQDRLLASMDDEKIAKMPGKDVMIAFGIAVDKERLITGQSAAGGTLSLLAVANAVHAAYQAGKLKGDDKHVIEAEVVPAEVENVVESPPEVVAEEDYV
jgi:hypothetical protein